MHKPVVLTILSAIVIALISMPSVYADLIDDAQDNISYAGMTFAIYGDSDAELIEVEDPSLETLVIPATFEKDGQTYNVIGIDGTNIYHDVVNRMDIPSTVTYVRGGFYGLSALEWIEVDHSNRHLCSVDGVLYDINMTTILVHPMVKPDRTYDMPDTVTTISEYCFAGSDKLESITISDRIVIIGKYAFDMCTSLENVNHDGAVNHLPDSLTIIAEGAFNNCRCLTDVKLPESLMVIGSYAFSECRSFTSLYIPPEVAYIGTGFLNDCINLESIEVSEINSYYESNEGVLYYSNSSSTSLHTYPCAKPDKSFRISDEVNAIEPMAFAGTTHLEKLTLSNSMKTIGPYALFGCETLREVYIPNSVMSIDHMAFSMCSNLAIVKGGNNVNVIGLMAFNSTGLTAAFLPDALRVIEPHAFSRCYSIIDVTLSESIESIGNGAFNECLNLTTITILGIDTALADGSLCVGTEDNVVEILVNIPSGMHLPDNVFDEYTIAHVSIIGEEPYPYENLIGVAICLLVLFFIIRLFREV